MQLKKIVILTLAALGLAATCTQPLAKTADEVRARCRAEHRPCVGLVLSGGGARGFAHTGVLDVIEELGIKIDGVTKHTGRENTINQKIIEHATNIVPAQMKPPDRVQACRCGTASYWHRRSSAARAAFG